MCFGGPKIQAPPPPPPAPPPPTPMATLSMTTERGATTAKGTSQAKRKRRGVGSLRISSGTNINSSGTGVNV